MIPSSGCARSPRHREARGEAQQWQLSSPHGERPGKRPDAFRPAPGHVLAESRKPLQAPPQRVTRREVHLADVSVDQRRSAQQAWLEGGVENVPLVISGAQLSECVQLGVPERRAGELTGRRVRLREAVTALGDDLASGVYEDGSDRNAARQMRFPREGEATPPRIRWAAPGGGVYAPRNHEDRIH